MTRIFTAWFFQGEFFYWLPPREKGLANLLLLCIMKLQAIEKRCLQGRVQFPTGGIVRERKLNR